MAYVYAMLRPSVTLREVHGQLRVALRGSTPSACVASELRFEPVKM